MDISNITNLIENAEQSMNALLAVITKSKGEGSCFFISNIVGPDVKYSLDNAELMPSLREAICQVYPSTEDQKARIMDRIKSLEFQANSLRDRLK